MGKKLRIRIAAAIKFVSFSIKQLKILTWWTALSPYRKYNGIAADGSIRAGKTVPMSMAFVFWAMDTFDGQNFAMCGKSIGSFKRNVWKWLKPALMARGYKVLEIRSINFITVEYRGHTNYFYIFGGKDERSQDLIQGITLAGILFDEVALMPESFVNQGTARCSVEGAKWWFNCNPDGPMHWFKLEWIDKAAEKKILHIHFEMTDNPSLSPDTIAKYKAMYSGLFYKRFILGLWVMAQGAIYDMFVDTIHITDTIPFLEKEWVACDYGTANPTVFLHQGIAAKKFYTAREYWYDSRATGKQKTDGEYADDLLEFLAGKNIPVIIDPSAASFIAECRKRGIRTKEANNAVLDGIRFVSMVLAKGKYFIHRSCKHTIEEKSAYIWDPKAQNNGEDKPVKQNDHASDAERYGIYTNRKLLGVSEMSVY